MSPDTGMQDYSLWHNMMLDSQQTHANPATISCIFKNQKQSRDDPHHLWLTLHFDF